MDYGLGNPQRIDIARSFVTSIGVTNADDSLQLLASDVTYRVLGHHALSGSFSGREAVAKHLAELISQTDGRFDPVKFEDWMLGLSHVSILVDVHVQVGSTRQQLQHLILMRFNAEDLIDEVVVFIADPEVAERLYGQTLRDGSTQDS